MRIQSLATQKLTGYEFTHCWHPNILSSDEQQESYNVALTAFIDDSH